MIGDSDESILVVLRRPVPRAEDGAFWWGGELVNVSALPCLLGGFVV